MRSRKELDVRKAVFCIGLLALFIAAIIGTRSAAAASCDLSFFNSLGFPNTVFTTVTPQATPIAHCEIIGKINPRTGVDGKPYAIGFHLRLPDGWNERFYFQGGGGTDGNLGDALGSGALSHGYAVVSTDAGHDNTADFDPNAGGTAAFGVDPQARIDYGYNAVDQVTHTAKTLIRDYYGRKIEYSYFVGCSNGGRQGMVASQRFPTYFDGIVSGDPGFDLPKAAVAEAWNEQVLAPLATKLSTNGQPYLPDTFSDADLALAANAILAACDALDGLADGIVDNYAACTSHKVYPQLKTIQCSGAKTDTCLSSDQIAALKEIYAGPKNSHGRPLYTDWQWDAGISGFLSLRLWSLGTPAAPGQPLVNNALNLTLGGGSLPHVFVTPPDVTPLTGLEAYIFGFNFDTDAPKIFKTSGIYKQSSMQFMTALSTNLLPFKRHGGRMIIYHGNSDGVFSPHDTINWYQAMDFTMHDRAESFVRLFLVPGMGHCSLGPGTTVFDAFTPLVQWVEQGIAPDSIVATAPGGPAPVGTPWPGRTRPLCPYPKQARYIGSGDINDAANFRCELPHDGPGDGCDNFDFYR
ncbi:MAG TPA: tannase/feruloyl esterase family alpha/beta hydrolase [Thermodesulfobacteriota bacterium]|nr:tannase/feruloyl esterase family alpha/beta hydrolase [Thermodesulfobacteriota bacterium]